MVRLHLHPSSISLFIITFATLQHFVSGLTSDTDHLALLDIKASLVDGPFGSLSAWNESLHFCHWPGVVCGNNHQRITALRLNGHASTGSISPSILNLTFLTQLHLADNNLKGLLPLQIGTLFRLQFLNLTNNSLTGEIPTGLANCSHLDTLLLSHNNFSGGFPSQFGLLSKLTDLVISKNGITGIIPPSIKNLSSLVTFSAESNNLWGSIPDLSGLKNLTTLRLTGNRLSGTLPPYFCNLSSIEFLSVADNDLSGQLWPNMGFCFPNLRRVSFTTNRFSVPFPLTLVTNMSRLNFFDISKNSFVGQVPVDLGLLQDLTWFNVEDNNLGGIGPDDDFSFFASLSNVTKLQILSLAGNGFKSKFPHSIGNLSSLTWLTLGSNQIYGSIPDTVGNLINLTSFAVENNFITGPIPSSICKLHNLGQLGFQFNQLSGSVTSCLGNLSRLYVLNLIGNNISGTVPPSLSNCSSLQQLFLAGNQLSGRIPTNFLSHLPQLIYLRLDNNSFTSSFPADVGNLINLAVLIASNNNLTGGIPATLGSCLGLEYVDLSGNSLQGKIPVSLSNLKAIGFLDLSCNNLSRIIPEELQGLVVLERLNLSYNQLEGKVPTKGVFANVTAVSIAGNEGLCGGIPSWHLPACPDTDARVKRLKLSLKWIIVVTAAAIFTVLLLICIIDGLRNSSGDPKTKSCQTLVAKNGFLWVTYKQLFDASDGFAPFNLIGEGKFGSVYRAMLDERPIAVEVMNLEQVGAAGSFRAECEALRTTRHRNLVKMITTCSSIDRSGNDFKAVVLELMPNGSLDSWLHPSPEKEKRYLNLWQRLDAAIDVAHALEYLHHDCQTPIVHCDLKPSNVLLDDQMVSHVSDFGLAKFLSSTTAETVGSDHVSSSTLIVRGTIGYVAPEYGMGCSVSTAGDIYSYGILLLEMITGKRPTDEMFNDNCSLHQLCKRASPDNIQDITDPFLFEESFEERQVKKHRRGCLVSLIEIGVKCCAESPADRMSIHQVIIELGAIKAKIPSAADGRKINNFFLQSEADDVVGMVREQVTN